MTTTAGDFGKDLDQFWEQFKKQEEDLKVNLNQQRQVALNTTQQIKTLYQKCTEWEEEFKKDEQRLFEIRDGITDVGIQIKTLIGHVTQTNPKDFEKQQFNRDKIFDGKIFELYHYVESLYVSMIELKIRFDQQQSNAYESLREKLVKEVFEEYLTNLQQLLDYHLQVYMHDRVSEESQKLYDSQQKAKLVGAKAEEFQKKQLEEQQRLKEARDKYAKLQLEIQNKIKKTREDIEKMNYGNDEEQIQAAEQERNQEQQQNQNIATTIVPQQQQQEVKSEEQKLKKQ